jgi:hypothetical protein
MLAAEWDGEKERRRSAKSRKWRERELCIEMPATWIRTLWGKGQVTGKYVLPTSNHFDMF